MLTLNHVTADGVKDDAALPVTIYHPVTHRPTGAVVWVSVATQAELYDLARKCRRHEVEPGTRQMRQSVDGVKVQQLAMARFVKRWTGVQGANGEDLPCVPAVLNALPEWMADQITDGIRGVPNADEPDVTEVHEAGFRESA